MVRATGTGFTAPSARTQFPGPPDHLAPLGRLGRYLIQELIAEGAQGVLYRGIDETLNRTVAIKIMQQTLTQSAASLERFRREARLIASVQSDHVVRLFQVGSEPDFPPFLVMEFVDGESLRDRIDRREVIPVRQSVLIIRDTAVGLQAAHKTGLVHRDVKPSNILLDQTTSRARLTDFGMAVESSESIRMTLEGTILGTPAYMSPEQVSRPGVRGRTQ
jgi:serine/threonine protein kinase